MHLHQADPTRKRGPRVGPIRPTAWTLGYPCCSRTRSGRTITGEFGRSTGRTSCGSRAMPSMVRNKTTGATRSASGLTSGRLAARIGRRPSRKRLHRLVSLEESLTGQYPQLAVTQARERRRRRRLCWLHGCTGSRTHQRRASLRPVPVPAAGGLAAAGSPAGQRRPTGGPAAAGTAWQSRTVVPHQRTSVNQGEIICDYLSII